MTQLDNIRTGGPVVKFPSRCGSASLSRQPRYSANQAELPHTYDGALKWISRHDTVIRKFVNLLEQFPNLVQDEELKYLNLFLTDHYQTKVNAEQERAVSRILASPHARRDPSTFSLLTPEKIDVYVSGEICETQWTNTDFIARELAQHFRVQTDPPLPRHPGFSTEEGLVSSCTVMVFVISETSLNDPFCLHQLRTAIGSHVPVVLVREPEGTDLPEAIISDSTPITLSRPVTALADIADTSPVLFLDDSTKPPGRDENRGVNKSIDLISSGKENVPLKQVMLLDWFEKELPSSCVFAFDHRSNCMTKLVSRIKNVAFGEVLLDGYGNTLPTELPNSPEQLEGPSFFNQHIADMAESLKSRPTSALWGAIPTCGRCGQHMELPNRLCINTPHPPDPTLTKFLHFSQRELDSQTQKDSPERPATAPSIVNCERVAEDKVKLEAQSRIC